jgi:hypothetical protein
MPARASAPEFARVLRGEDTSFAAFGRTPDEFMRDCADEDLEGLVHERVHEMASTAVWPSPVRASLERQARDNMASELARRVEIASVLGALAAEGVRPLLFKGTALAYTLYEAPHLRPRLDTDLFIRRAAVESVKRTLASLGYSQPAYCDGELLFGQMMFVKTDALGIDHVFDVHWKISTQSVAAGLVTFDELSAEAVGIPALGPAARCVGPAHALLLACVHAVVHHRSVERLIWVHDIHLLASSLSPKELDDFAGLAVAGGVAAVCGHSLTVARARLGTAVPESLLHRLLDGAGDEPSARYLEPGRTWRHEQASNFAALTRWRDRMRLAREVLLPSPAYMRKRYGLVSETMGTMLLPMLYVHRVLRGGMAVLFGRK